MEAEVEEVGAEVEEVEVGNSGDCIKHQLIDIVGKLLIRIIFSSGKVSIFIFSKL